MTGWYAMKRGWLAHECFAPKGKWSRAEAWVWLVENAAYAPTVIDIGGAPYTVPRGSLCHSLRFLAAKWGWSTKAVTTFLRDIESHGVIKTSVTQGGHKRETRRKQITLCNYEKYQSSGNARETQEKRAGNKEEQGNNNSVLSERETEVSEPLNVSVVTTALWAAGKQYLGSCGIKDPGSVIGRWLKGNEPTAILSAIEAAQKAGTHDPIPYITEILKGGHHGKPSKQDDAFNAFIAGARGTS